MNGTTIHVTVADRVPTAPSGVYLVTDNKQYRLKFHFDSEWDDYARKTARFLIGDWQMEVAFFGDTVIVPQLPKLLLIRTAEAPQELESLRVGVYAGDVITTQPVTIPVFTSILAAGGGVQPQDAAEMARVQAEADRVEAETARASAEYLRDNAELLRQHREELRVMAETARNAAEAARVSAEASRAAAEAAREQSIADITASLTAFTAADDAICIPLLIDAYGAEEALQRFVTANVAAGFCTAEEATARFNAAADGETEP